MFCCRISSHDERMTPNGQPRRFQIGVGENEVQVANRVRALFTEARQRDPTIFANPFLDLPDDKICDVVEIIEDIGLTLIDVDGSLAVFAQVPNCTTVCRMVRSAARAAWGTQVLRSPLLVLPALCRASRSPQE